MQSSRGFHLKIQTAKGSQRGRDTGKGTGWFADGCADLGCGEELRPAEGNVEGANPGPPLAKACTPPRPGVSGVSSHLPPGWTPNLPH